MWLGFEQLELSWKQLNFGAIFSYAWKTKLVREILLIETTIPLSYEMLNVCNFFQNQHCILNIHLEAVERLHHNQVTYKSKMVKNRSKITLSETWANNLTSDCYLSKTRWLANNSCMNRWQIDGQNLAGAWFKLT